MHLIKKGTTELVSFDCNLLSTCSKDSYYELALLDGLYCLVLEQLRSTTKSKSHSLNLKRRRLLIYIRRAVRVYSNGRRLPLHVSKHSHKYRVAKLKGYVILG